MPYQRMNKAQRITRLNEWIDLRLSGHPYEAIAEQYDVRKQTVFAQVTAALHERTNISVDKYRDQTIEQLNYIIKVMGDRAANGDDKCAAVVLKAMDQRSKLLGTYAVQTSRLEVTQTDGTIDQEIARLTEELSGETPGQRAESSQRTPPHGADQQERPVGPVPGPPA